MLEWACRAWQILQSLLIFQGTLCIKAEESADNETILACRFGLTATLAMQVSKLITTNSAEHFELMRTNKQHYHSTFPCGLTAETPHLDLGIVLGYASVTPLHQGTQADQADSEHASQASDYRDCQHSPRHAPISAEDSWCDEDTPGQRDGSERYSQPGSPEYRATSPGFSFRGSDSASQASGAFSPQYEVTSPSYSPRGSQLGAPGEPVSPLQPMMSAAAAHDEQAPPQSAAASDAKSDGHATTESASIGQASSDEPAQASRPQENAAAPPDSADSARPSTARGRGSTQQRSAFCFARPTKTQADEPEKLTHAASAEDEALSRAQVSSSCQAPAEEAHQCLATGSGTILDGTDLLATATAHHSAAVPADAVLSEVASRLQQAEAVQAQVAPTEVAPREVASMGAEQADAVQTASSHTAAPQAEAVQAASSQAEGVQTKAVQADSMAAAGVPFAPQAFESKAHAKPTFVWDQSEASASNSCGSNFFATRSPSHGFATSPSFAKPSSMHSIGNFQAGGSSSQQPSLHNGRTSSKHRTSRGKQSGGVRSVPEHPAMHDIGHSMQGIFATAADQSDGGADSTSTLFTFSTDAAELSSGKHTFSFGGSSQHAFSIRQSATAGSATAGSAAATECKFAFGDAESSSASHALPATAKASTGLEPWASSTTSPEACEAPALTPGSSCNSESN